MPQSYSPLQAPSRLLFGPGPSMVAPRVYQAMSQPVVGHLDPFFFQMVEEVRTLLGYAYSTANAFNIAVSGTGSSGMEAAVANFVEPGTKFALLTNGFFGDRIGEMARRHGGDVVRLVQSLGRPLTTPRKSASSSSASGRAWWPSYRRRLPPVSSTRPNRSATRRTKWMRWSIADCVTSLGGMPVMVDENGIDIAYSCSQKGLGLPSRTVPDHGVGARV